MFSRKVVLVGLVYPFVLLSAIAALQSCNKDQGQREADTAQVNMRLTDGPAAYDHLYLDIQQVQVTTTGQGTVNLTPLRAGVYDILSLRNGIDTLLAKAFIGAGNITQVRLILGSNNSVVVDGNTYVLNTPSAQESGVKLNFNKTVSANGTYDLWLDFDAARSIVKTGNSYQLKPSIRAYSAETNGKLKGYVSPVTAKAIVYAINGNDTLTAIPNSDGYFQINGATAGTYQVLVNPGIAGLQLYSQTNVNVSYSSEVNLGTITLLP